MKKCAFLLLLLVFYFSACSSISVHPMAYVEGTDHFTASEINYKQLSKTILWQNYELRLDNVKNKLKQTTIFGQGKISGTLSQTGHFFKDGAECFQTRITNEIGGTVTENSYLLDESYRIEIDSGKYSFDLNTTEEGAIVTDERILPLVITEITTAINEHGKIYKMWLNYSMGISVEIDGELYAVIDYDHNPAQIRENPTFSKQLNEEQKDLLTCLLLMLFNYDVSFKSYEIDANTKIDIK